MNYFTFCISEKDFLLPSFLKDFFFCYLVFEGYLLMCLELWSFTVVSNSLWLHALRPAGLLSVHRFPRQDHWSGLPWPPPGDLPNLQNCRLAVFFFFFFFTWWVLFHCPVAHFASHEASVVIFCLFLSNVMFFTPWLILRFSPNYWFWVILIISQCSFLHVSLFEVCWGSSVDI